MRAMSESTRQPSGLSGFPLVLSRGSSSSTEAGFPQGAIYDRPEQNRRAREATLAERDPCELLARIEQTSTRLRPALARNSA